jgi:enoyl-CoA hydratase/carnithine racemase
LLIPYAERRGIFMPSVLMEKQENVLRVWLNRPSALNAINTEVLQELETGLNRYANDDTVRAVVLSGKEGCFAAGADIKELARLDEEGIRRFHDLRERTLSLLEELPFATVAVIQRYALGTGLELALSCDFRIAAEDAQMGVPSARLGLVESYDYTGRLVRAVGPAWARKLIFTGERVDARTAFAVGLVEEVVLPGEVFSRAEELVSRILKNSAYAIRESKRVICRCARDPNLAGVEDRVLPLMKACRYGDFREGAQAFLEKREREFK